MAFHRSGVLVESQPMSLRVQFIHGLESNPQGTKARTLAEHFDVRTPAMDTRDFDGCVELQARVLAEHRPRVLVGSSFGGAVAVELLRRGDYRGPTLLLAPAARRYDRDAVLPEGARVMIVHGHGDDVIDIADSRALAATGSAESVDLIELDDDHRLTRFVDSGGLITAVRKLATGA